MSESPAPSNSPQPGGWKTRVKAHPIIAAAITFGAVVIALGTFTDATGELVAVGRLLAGHIRGDTTGMNRPQDGRISMPPPTITRPAVLDLSGDAAVGISEGQPLIYTWSSKQGQTACQLTVNDTYISGISLSGSETIPSDDPWYPSVAQPTIFVLSCTDGNSSTSRIGVASIAEPRLSASKTPSDRLIEISLDMLNDGANEEGERMVREIEEIRADAVSPNDEVLAGILLFQIYKEMGRSGSACHSLDGVVPMAVNTDYAKAVNRLVLNHCIR